MKPKQSNTKDKDHIQQLEKQLKEAQKALRESELKNKLLDEMVNFAEDEFNVPVRKKSSVERLVLGLRDTVITKVNLQEPIAPINLLCQMIGITRSAYYKAAKRQKQNDSRDKLVLEEVRRIRKNMPKLGTRKVYYLLKPFLKENNIKMGRDKLFTILKANGMLAERRKRIAFTTESRHYLFKYPNLTKDIEPEKPHQLWVSDMTYLRTGGNFTYLSLITAAVDLRFVKKTKTRLML